MLRTCVVIFDVKREIIIVLFIVFPAIAIDIHFVRRFIRVNYVRMKFDERNRAEYLIATDGVHTNLGEIK